MLKPVQFRVVGPKDAEALLDIYAPYVRETAITFEYDVPSVAEFQGRITRTLEKYPYLAAVRGEELVGYAYAGPSHERAAYGWGVETSIYLRQDCRGQGIGRPLYQLLEDILRAQGVQNINASIAYAAQEDEYLTHGSVVFHQRMGYRMAGRFIQCGYKFKRWYDLIWMEKLVGEHPREMPPLRLFEEVRQGFGL